MRLFIKITKIYRIFGFKTILVHDNPINTSDYLEDCRFFLHKLTIYNGIRIIESCIFRWDIIPQKKVDDNFFKQLQSPLQIPLIHSQKIMKVLFLMNGKISIEIKNI